MFNKKIKIAIIGAGISGLTAANDLKKLGYNDITIFESKNYIGGKIKTYEYNNRFYELGAIWCTPAHDKFIKLTKEFNVLKTPARIMDKYLMPNGNLTHIINYFFKMAKGSIIRPLIKYLITIIRFNKIKIPGFVNTNMKMNIDINSFSKNYGFNSIIKSINPTMIGCGYGNLKDVPAIYWMKFLTTMYMKCALSSLIMTRKYRGFPPWYLKNGTQSLPILMSKNMNIKLHSNVTNLIRFDNMIKITVNDCTYTFDKVIITLPLHETKSFMNHTPVETELSNEIQDVKILVTIAETNNKVNAFIPNKINHICSIIQMYSDTNVTICYQIIDKKISKESATLILKDDVNKLGINMNKILIQNVWSYFPHVRTDALNVNFYKKFDDLQGKQGIYYIGSLFNFESLEHTVVYAKHIIKRFFK